MVDFAENHRKYSKLLLGILRGIINIKGPLSIKAASFTSQSYFHLIAFVGKYCTFRVCLLGRGFSVLNKALWTGEIRPKL